MKIQKILKFGGSSVGSPKAIKKVSEIIKKSSRKQGVALVVSAFQGVTDQLINCARLAAKNDKRLPEEIKMLKDRHIKAINLLVKIKKERRKAVECAENLFRELESALEKISQEKNISNINLDQVASFGERLSAYIVAASMRNAYFADAREFIKTDNNFVSAVVDFKKTNRKIQNYFRNKRGIPVVTGFLGSTAKGETTTLGRGGSDYTASILGAALNVEVIEIWTDVDGVMSADPRLVKAAQVLPSISYEEAIELAYFGAKVIHPATMLPAIKKKIPILIKNTFHPASPGTVISSESENSRLVKGVTAIDDIALVIIGGVSLAGIPGSAARVFGATASKGVNVILISQSSSEHTICFGIKQAESKAALKALEREFRREIKSGRVSVSSVSDQAIVAMVGDGMRGVPGIAGKLFRVLGDAKINVSAIAQGGSERNISFVVDSPNKVKALNLVHEEFFVGGSKNIFIVGTGNIGGTLLNQIKALKNDRLRVRGIINDKKMLIAEEGVGLNSWERKLEKGADQDFSAWLEWAESLNVANKVFVDCTASEAVAKKYIEIAKSGFNIVTPNKKFNVLSMKEYRDLREVMSAVNKKFLYETNVGAGLPVISTLQDLLKSGDRITKIEGVFSGTLSYLFNSYDGTKPFSKVVAEAKAFGYTEPDPREDLNGQDVGRKLLVLAREIGLELEMKDVKIENLVPKALQWIKASGDFLKRLKEFDADFKKLLERARKQNKVLRYVAKLEKGKASASLQAVSWDNPLASTRGADNIFAIYTKRYNERPLVVQGPGAGAEVTAGGVLVDILKI